MTPILAFVARTQANWSQGVPGYVAKADRNWPSVKATESVVR